MATRRYGLSVGEQGPVQITEGVGAAVNADDVEVTVDLNARTQSAEGRLRVCNKLYEILQYISAKSKWPPA